MLQRIQALYQPANMKMEHQEPYIDEKIIQSRIIRNFQFSSAIPHFLFYTMGQVNLLRKEYEITHNIHYDLILVTRPDVALKTRLVLEDYLLQAEILGLDVNRCRFFGGKPMDSSIGISFYLNSPNDLLFFAKPEVIDRYIAANQTISDDFLSKHCINVVSIYTANELQAGIFPIPLSYSLGKDYTFYGYRKANDLAYSDYHGIKKYVAHFLRVMLSPVRKMEKKYPWLRSES